MGREIYNIVRAKITTDDLQAFETQAQKMKVAAKEESGTLVYDFFINRETKDVLIIEKYQDDEAFMAHMTRFVTDEYIPKLLTKQEIVSIEMPGLITKEIEDFFNLSLLIALVPFASIFISAFGMEILAVGDCKKSPTNKTGMSQKSSSSLFIAVLILLSSGAKSVGKMVENSTIDMENFSV